MATTACTTRTILNQKAKSITTTMASTRISIHLLAMKTQTQRTTIRRHQLRPRDQGPDAGAGQPVRLLAGQ